MIWIDHLPIKHFTKLRGFQTKSSIKAEEVYLKIWRLLTQILTWHMPSVGTRGGCFPWPMIALVRYCWLGRDIVNSTTRDDNQQWPKMTIIKAELTRAQRTRMRHFGGGQCQSRPALKMEQKHRLSQLSHPTLDSLAKDNVNLHFANPYSNWLQCLTCTLHTEQLGSYIYRVIFLTGPPLNLLSVGWKVTDFKKNVRVPDWPPLMIEKSLCA